MRACPTAPHLRHVHPSPIFYIHSIVEFASADAAKKAIETLNETALEGRNVFVREDRGGASTERPTGTSLYVGNLPFSVGWGELKDLFAPYNVVRADVKTDHRTHRSRGFGIVLVATAEDAQKAIDALNEYEWEGRNIVVRMDQPRA